MDDCNWTADPLYRIEQERSDSSMDDCNNESAVGRNERSHVQIPLWTIVTIIPASASAAGVRSDSSMDDCNFSEFGTAVKMKRVQIPLWTIVTMNRLLGEMREATFRFLYGRL